MADFNDYAPVSKAEVAAAAAAPTPPAPAAPAPSASARPRPAPPVAIGARSLTIALQHPRAYDGREFHAITLRRPTSREVGQYFEALVERVAEDGAEKAFLFFPVFYAQDGAPVPQEVLADLDDDDRADVMERVSDFLPRRLLALQAAGLSDSGPDTGGDTGPTSST